MTSIRATLFVSLLSIGCLAAAEAQARPGGSSGGSYRGGSSGAWHGSSSGSWRGAATGRYYGHGGYGHGGYGHGGYYRHGYYWPFGIGIALAAPWYWGSYYYPYYYGAPYYPATYGVSPYQEVPPAYEYSTPPEPSTDIGPVSGPGAPVERPLYLNYCASSQAYYPKVTSCAEGWQMRRPTYQ